MTISEEIITIANTLANKGKQPTVALIKAKLTSRAPLPEIISVLKTWQHDPDYIQITSSTNAQTLGNELKVDNETSAAITLALKPIKEELAEIKKLLLALSKNK
jgi:hypothetical protein